MFLRYGEIKSGKICSKRQTGNNGTLLPGEGMAAIPIQTRVQRERTGFPRIKYGVGLIKCGMTKQYNYDLNSAILNTIFKDKAFWIPVFTGMTFPFSGR
jgi:hypothetical protein